MSDELMIESYNLYLLHACRNGNELGAQQVPVVVTLLEKGADVNTRDELGNTPLHWAAILGYLDICKYIMEKLDNEHPKNANGKSPIHFAAQYGHLEVYKLLVENIEDKNHGDNDGITPLHMAAKYGHLEVYR